jgi:putative intracellular protease/amidase
MGKLLAYFHAHNKITALDCHAPIALLSTMPHVDRFVAELAATGHAKPSPGWIYSGYHVTVFANSEEAVATKFYLKGNQMKFWPQNALAAAGAKVSVKDPAFTPQIVTDRELITGQNPASAPLVAAEIIKRMK